MRKYFKGVTDKQDDGWLMASAGNSTIDGQDYVITTNSLKGDEVPGACNDAKTFTQLVAGLLNYYYNKGFSEALTEKMLIEMGTCVEEDRIPHPDNPEIPF